MKIDLQKFFNSTPRVIDLAIALTISSLSVALAIAISGSDKVAIADDWLKIEKQAIANQKDLERSLLIIEIQKAAISELRDNTKDFSRRYRAGEELLDQVEHAAEVIPEHQIQKLRETIGESELLLNKPFEDRTDL